MFRGLAFQFRVTFAKHQTTDLYNCGTALASPNKIPASTQPILIITVKRRGFSRSTRPFSISVSGKRVGRGGRGRGKKRGKSALNEAPDLQMKVLTHILEVLRVKDLQWRAQRHAAR